MIKNTFYTLNNKGYNNNNVNNLHNTPKIPYKLL